MSQEQPVYRQHFGRSRPPAFGVNFSNPDDGDHAGDEDCADAKVDSRGW